jgi:hypothetical protein
MANLYYPQLSSGALAQYPIQKTRVVRTIKNVLADGSMILLSDPDGARLVWQLAYTELSSADVSALQAHFTACVGPFHAFTFIDPTDNMLASSADMTAEPWVTSSLIQMTSGVVDFFGGNGAFTLTNTGQISQTIAQTLQVPAGYQYCFSVYAMSNISAPITLLRNGPSTQDATTVTIGPAWARIVSSGTLSDAEVGFTVAISLTAGQQVQLYGPQLEAQIVPSPYRPTAEAGGVYANAHWAIDQLTITANAPNLFSTACGIETAS